MNVTVVADDAPGAATLVLSGELDLASTSGFEVTAAELLAKGRDRLLVDLSGLTFCDSVGLNALVRARNRCQRRGGWLRVSGMHGQVAHVIRITGLLAALAADE